MDVGLELRQAREQRGLSLHQISNTTKISLRVLQAIEAADESRLPAPVFTRSFVKTCAAQVGLDPDDTARRYLEQFAPVPAPVTADAAHEPTPGEAPRESIGWSLTQLARGRFGLPTVLFLVGVVAFALVARNYRRAHTGATRLEPTATLSAAAVTPAPTPSPALVGTSGVTPAPPQSLHLEIAPTGPCWVRATVGGEAVLAKLLNAGDRKAVDAASGVTLRVGDAGAFAFSINGTPARVPGARGQPVTVHITRENYRQFVMR